MEGGQMLKMIMNNRGCFGGGKAPAAPAPPPPAPTPVAEQSNTNLNSVRERMKKMMRAGLASTIKTRQGISGSLVGSSNQSGKQNLGT